MKSIFTRSATAVVLSLGLGISAPAVAFASGNQSSTGVHVTTNTHAHQTAMKAFVAAKLNINLAFKSSVSVARTTLRTALAAASTSAQRSAAQTAFHAALTAALSARTSALSTLGDPPVANSSATVTLTGEARAFGVAMAAINETFKNTVSVARLTFTTAVKGATTSAQRITARAAFKLALKNAMTARQASITSLGGPPTK